MIRTFLNSESLMQSHGYDSKEHLGAVKCPLYQTSTFAFKSAEEGKSFFELAYGLREPKPGEEQKMIYSRLNHPNLDLIEKRLAALEKCDDAAFFASGMAAISAVMFAWLSPGDLLLYGAPVYGGTDHLINHVLPLYGINIVRFTANDSLDAIIKRVEEHYPGKTPSVIFIEVPGNPVNSLIDIEMCSLMAEKYDKLGKRPVLVVDNTFLGPVYQKPLEKGADISLYSATKFIGGHSDLIAGACAGSFEKIAELKHLRTFFGSTLDSHTCWLVSRSLETLHIRVKQQVENAIKVSRFLKNEPKIQRVYYPGLLEDDHPQREIYNRQCLSPGSMIAFEIKGGEEEAFRFLNNLQLFKIAVSLGSTESLAEHPATMTHVDVAHDDRVLYGITDQLIRLSIGLENSDDLINDIRQALERAIPD
ncbi:PLP-dependent transferase [Alkalitalea saponilacus]|uniref:Methionine-gamma-lyase n=1 Tax=Alkalitalea saponilacus TaxID=889453 RepID=A0A1T5B9P1_9BACT|nr:PLP-dependent transferase [Alkalitalea saponilacus]ASB49739.1 methionine gamma-lyase [Alkalitalea saponilacus]SKB43991.1 methionine-gamma-lyase [Alkalitalea saponilacus]